MPHVTHTVYVFTRFRDYLFIYRTAAILTRQMMAAQIDGHCPDVDHRILSRIEQKLELIGEVSFELVRRPNCIDSAAWNYLCTDTRHGRAVARWFALPTSA